MRGLVSVGLFFILIASSLWFYGNGFLFKLFNGGTTLFQIASELNTEPLFLYGMILLYCLSLLFFYLDHKKGLKKFRNSLLIITSLLFVPIYAHIVINEIKMELQPFTKEVFADYPLDFAVLEDIFYEKETKTVFVTLNYGTSKNNIRDLYLKEKEITIQKKHEIKQRLGMDMQHVIHAVWAHTHQPKRITFAVKWGSEILYTTTADKRERYLSYFDSDERDDFHTEEKSLYYRLDIVREGNTYVIKIKNNEGEWINVGS